MNSEIIRHKFLEFFQKNGHTIVPSSSLIPAEDPTLLFTNAGMNQFKDAFLGKEKRSYTRATSIQKCVRAGGKHNDLEQVGFTARHLTFFEMMGNFSFGDYFKEAAIQYAWDFLTKVMEIPAEHLYPTVFETDDESFNIWHEQIGVPQEKISRLGASENFWQMGDTGPCGPCTEILVDRGEKYSCGASCKPGCDCSRYMEVWNLVFMQYDRQTDGTLLPLAKPGVDTGMGFERLCTIMQKKDSVYQTDVFTDLIKKIEQLTGRDYAKSSTYLQAAFHVLCDHVRSSSLLIADGCTPSNDGRGYVLRKIIRRAALFAQKLSDDRTLFPKLAQEFISFFSSVYPELTTNKVLILTLLQNEIDRFSSNLLNGQQILDCYLTEQRKKNSTVIEGTFAFKLYDTYGFPLEITNIIAQENNFSVDALGFEQEMTRQQAQSGKKSAQVEVKLDIPASLSTKFVGYETLESTSPITFVEKSDDTAWIVTEVTPFYVECGGQVNDSGWITINNVTYQLLDLKKVGTAIAAQISLWDKARVEHQDAKMGEFSVGDSAHCIVDGYKRMNTVRNHTATHMLQAALIQVLGKQVKQAGSVVAPDYLRFDFTNHEPMTLSQVAQVENIINQKIQEDIKTKIFVTTLADAKQSGVISFFGEKYNPESVRVIEIPGFSAELCGGTHASSTGIIGCFKITSEIALSSGVRRIVAVTGPEAVRIFQESFNIAKALSEKFKVKQSGILDAIEKFDENHHETLKEIKQLRKQVWKAQIPEWQAQITTVNNVPFLYLELTDIANDDVKQIFNEIEKKTPGFFVAIIKQSDKPNSINFVSYVSKSLEKQFDLKKFGNFLKELGLRGGGSPTLIQGAGEAVSNLKTKITEYLKKE